MENKKAEPVSKEERKRVKALSQKKVRLENQMFLIEGVKPVLEAIANISSSLKLVYVSERLVDQYALVLETVAFKVVSDKEIAALSNLKTSQGMIAVANYFNIAAKKEGLTLVLDEIQDPGNFGTIIRSADWFGVKEIVCSSNCVDLYNPKTIQATMGAAFRMRVEYCDLEEYLAATSLPVYGAFLEGENVYKKPLNTASVLVMGNEGNGISDAVAKFISHRITIPRVGESESLNVGTATSVLLSEFTRSTFL
ncbi:MAG: TrmH family RNA methyltransferase [Lishizhenia sp.]